MAALTFTGGTWVIPGGGGGGATAVAGEVPSGTVNGSNAAFTTAHAYLGSTTAAYRNGIREVRGVGYTESGASTITFTTAPATGDDIQVDYLY